MISVNTNYTNLRDSGANIEWRIVNGSNTFTVANLISGTLSAGCMEKVSIGNCFSAELDLTLWGVTVDTSNPLVLQFRASGGTTWYSKGTFYIDTLEKSPYTEETEIKAFDAMLKTEVGYMATNVWVNTTDLEVVNNIASDLGVAIDGNTFLDLDSNPIALTHAPHIGENGTTDREMLSYIATMRGGNWIIDSNNSLRLIYPSNAPANTANVDLAVVNFAASETLTVSKVKVNVDSETYYLAPSNISEDAWKALAGYCIEVKLPFYGSQAVADALLTQYNGKSFVPYQSEGAYVDPKYEIGDGVRFQKGTTYYTTLIANQIIDIGWLCPSDLYLKDEEKLDSLYPYLSPRERETLYQFEELQSAVEDAESAASAAQTAVGNANYKEQTIYISKASGTSSVAANTTWVTNTTGNQNEWTTTRPVYDSRFPVLFVATQRQSVSQSSGTTCTCTTPVKDQTTTVIDGGHITTGTIDASVVNVTNINASNIETGTLTGVTISGNTISGNTISGGTISGTTITGSTLTSATANGSVQIANGNINFFKNATTTGTPFSQIKHTVDSSQGDSIEWTNSGYTKLVNTGGGQWTADFIQFALNSNNPSLRFLIYNASDGSCVEVRNTDYAYLNGSQLRANRAGHGDNAAIRVAHGTANKEAGVFVKRTDTDRSIELLVGSGGINRGIYVADANMDGWLIVYNDSTVGINKPLSLSTALGVAYGGTGATTAKAARANLNMVSNLLMSGVSTTDIQVSSDITEYSAFIIVGVPDTTAKSTCFIPKAALSTTSTRWQVADNSYYIAADLYTSGNTLRMKVAGTNHGTKTLDIYGLRGA